MARPSQKDRIYTYILEAYEQNGYSPSISEIAAHLSLSAKSNIHRQMQQLVREGALQNLGGRYVPTSPAAADTMMVQNATVRPRVGDLQHAVF